MPVLSRKHISSLLYSPKEWLASLQRRQHKTFISADQKLKQDYPPSQTGAGFPTKPPSLCPSLMSVNPKRGALIIIILADGLTTIMGFFDALVRQADAIRHAAEAALEFTRNHAQEAECKLQEMVDQSTEVAQNTADEGVDITEAIDGAVEVALKALEDTLNAAMDAINRFLNEASKKIFNFLGGYLLQFLLKPMIATVDFVLERLASLGDQLKRQISSAVQTIKVTIQKIVRRIGHVLGPRWQFVKKLWKILFGVEPEQCVLTAAWFDERMKRTEKQLLHRRSGEPWRPLQLGPPPRARMQALLTESSPRAGSLVQLTLDEPFTDNLGGHQCLQISVLYYRWRTEEFLKVSSAFLGIGLLSNRIRIEFT
ncbi:hypothetical protein NA56DRAFT_662420 [Hyaloscypha hepaticicola]|uniref:Uncharacterized protein n=1 Tax=Hyaloscypha hepaticicola TaxID=2082293 RepID=A0A2J6PSU8_9HELO|nr:hypothetical protein NA56DRAFT_662420 [Hyaloscypha hepaticicola]